MRTLLTLFLALIAGNAHALPTDGYQNCAILSKTAPEKALAMADAWLREDRALEALHCRALSLFTLKRYTEAAKALEEVFTETPPEEIVLSVNLLRQAARAHALAKDPSTANQRFARAIGILQAVRKPTPLTHRLLAETLLERGELLHKLGDKLAALQDMDFAVSLELLGERALIVRAGLLTDMKQYDLALKDAEAALRLAPQNIEARRMLKKIAEKM